MVGLYHARRDFAALQRAVIIFDTERPKRRAKEAAKAP